MKIQIIRDQITSYLDAQAAIYGETADLTAEVNTAITDEIAGICETTNPTNDYPPVKK